MTESIMRTAEEVWAGRAQLAELAGWGSSVFTGLPATVRVNLDWLSGFRRQPAMHDAIAEHVAEGVQAVLDPGAGYTVGVAVTDPSGARFLQTQGKVGQIVPLAAGVTDEAAVARAVLARLIDAAPTLEVAGAVPTAGAALAFLAGTSVDLIVLERTLHRIPAR